MSPDSGSAVLPILYPAMTLREVRRNKRISGKRVFAIACTSSILLFFSSSCKKIAFDDFNSPSKQRISDTVWFHRTSGSVFTITDEEDFGLVYGNVVKLGYESKKKSHILVAYRGFDSKLNATGPITLAQIDLKTKKVTIVSDPDNSILNTMSEANEFSP